MNRSYCTHKINVDQTVPNTSSKKYLPKYLNAENLH